MAPIESHMHYLITSRLLKFNQTSPQDWFSVFTNGKEDRTIHGSLRYTCLNLAVLNGTQLRPSFQAICFSPHKVKVISTDTTRMLQVGLTWHQADTCHLFSQLRQKLGKTYMEIFLYAGGIVCQMFTPWKLNLKKKNV